MIKKPLLRVCRGLNVSGRQWFEWYIIHVSHVGVDLLPSKHGFSLTS